MSTRARMRGDLNRGAPVTRLKIGVVREVRLLMLLPSAMLVALTRSTQTSHSGATYQMAGCIDGTCTVHTPPRQSGMLCMSPRVCSSRRCTFAAAGVEYAVSLEAQRTSTRLRTSSAPHRTGRNGSTPRSACRADAGGTAADGTQLWRYKERNRGKREHCPATIEHQRRQRRRPGRDLRAAGQGAPA